MALFEEGQTGLRPRGSHDVQIKYVGDWTTFNYLIRNSDLILASAAKAGQHAFAEAYKDAVVRNLKEGGRRFGYAPMAPDYAAYKARKGGGNRLFSWSGLLIDSVQVMQNYDGTRHMVGIPKNIPGPDYHAGQNSLNVDEYANALEHGYALPKQRVYVEPRPIFSDTFRFTMGGKEGLRKFIEAHITGKFFEKKIRVSKRFIR
jgi:hypothetical protein